MRSTVGQTAIGIASDGYTIEAGYWYRDAGGEPEICGDVKRDGEVSAADAVIALEIAASGSASCDPATFTAADVSGDGQVTSLDALMILKAAADAIEIC
ncbi:MAG: dockerin type I repeat-containing protein [Pseudomonadota bacterium]|nr:dockerin type I repeat-containing protein [Pseudomonadota bacterium]